MAHLRSGCKGGECPCFLQFSQGKLTMEQTNNNRRENHHSTSHFYTLSQRSAPNHFPDRTLEPHAWLLRIFVHLNHLEAKFSKFPYFPLNSVKFLDFYQVKVFNDRPARIYENTGHNRYNMEDFNQLIGRVAVARLLSCVKQIAGYL